MPSVDELNAGFDAAMKSLKRAIADNRDKLDHTIPFVGINPYNEIVNYLASDDGRQHVLSETRDVLTAAELVRATTQVNKV